jgi:hypothetical protein
MLATASRDQTARVWESASGEPVTPPLRHASKVTAIAFSPDGQWLATGSGDGQIRFWDLRPVEFDLDQCVSLARLLNSRKLDMEGDPVPVLPPEAQADWSSLKEQMPGQFSVSSNAVRSWHRVEYEAAARARSWKGAIEHLDWLVCSMPNAWAPYWQRANAYASLRKWEDAVRDFSRVIELDPDHAEAYARRGSILSRHLGLKEAGDADLEMARRLLSGDFPPNQQTNNPNSKHERTRESGVQ